jgi:hypothetical protein
MDDLELLKRVRPRVAPPREDARAAARRSLDQTIARRRHRRHPSVRWGAGAGLLAPALGVLVVVAVVAVFLGLHAHKPGSASERAGSRVVFRALPEPPPHRVTPAAMKRTLMLVRQRLDASLPGARAFSHGSELTVTLSPGTKTSATEVAAIVQRTSRLLFYDWEADAITPHGLSVARLLNRRDPVALKISQGTAGTTSGTAGAGSMSLYAAVRLAGRQPRWVSPTNSRPSPEYFMFARAGSSTCATAARYYHTTPANPHCYLAGPQPSQTLLAQALPPGVRPSARSTQTLAVPRGWAILQAIPPSFSRQLPWSDPGGQYYVLKDDAALTSSSLTNAHQSTDATGAPVVSFGFTPRGAAQFQTLTARIARRGQLLSGPGQHLYQHFAVALETQLITVPYIDYEANPFGIPGNNGADIQGGFTTKSARELAAEITPLPVLLKLVANNHHARQP